MSIPKIFFIELNVDNKLRYTCDIAENLYEKKVSVTIFVKEGKNANNLDRQLWIWKQESFIPHILINEITDPIDEAIIITTSTTIPLQTQAIILFDPHPLIVPEQYQYIIDFAEIYHPERLKLSRERYKQIKNKNNCELEFFKLGAFLKNFMA